MYQQNLALIGAPARTAVELSQNPLQGLLTGYQFGNALYEQDQQRGLQQDLAAAFDPQTGQVDNAKVLQALMRRDPATGIRFMQQKRLEDQQQAGLQWLLGQAGGPSGGAVSGGGAAVGSTGAGISPEARRNLMVGGLLKGDIGGAAEKLGELQQNAYLQDYTRGQELINVTDPKTGAVYQVLRGQALPGPSAQPIPSGQPAPSAQPIPGGTGAPPVKPIPPGQASPGTPDLFSRYQDAPWFSDLMSAARLHNIDPRVAIALVHQESGGNPNSVSPAGAIGLGQLMPDTARQLGVTDPRNPTQNVMGSMRYLRQLLDKYGGDYQKALAAYNAGPGAVDKYGGVPPYRETQHYVPAVLGSAGVQVAQAPGGPVTDAGSPGILVKRPPAQELQEQEQTKLPYQIAEEQRLEKARIAAEQRAAKEKMAAEQRAGPNKLTVGGEEAWVESVYKPALLEQKTNIDKLGKLDLMERLNQKGLTGPGAPFWQGVKAFLNAAGVPSSVVDVTPEQELVAQSNNLVWDTLAQQKGPQTDNDFKRMQAIWPNLQNTPEANQFLIDSSRAILNRRQRQIDFYRKNYQEYAKSGIPSALDDAWNATPEAQRSVWDEPAMRQWAGAAGGAQTPGAPGAAAPAGQTAPTPGAAAPTATGGGKTFSQQDVIDLAKKYNKPPAEIRQSLESKGYIYAP